MSQQRNATLPIYIATVMLCYTQAAGITTIYSLASVLYREFNDPLNIAWVVTAYYLVAAGSSAICGRLGDLLGRRRVALTTLLVGGIGSLVSGLSPGLSGIIIGCALQGVSGGVMSLAIGIARDGLPANRVPFAVGVLSAASTVGAGISFMIAGVVIDHFSWHGGFFMKAILATLTAGLLLVCVPGRLDKPASLGGIRVVPGLLFAPAIAGIFVASQLAHSRTWLDAVVWAITASSLLLLAFWARHQAMQSRPLINVRALAHRKVLIGNLCIAVLALSWMQSGQIMSLLFQQPLWTGVGFGLTASLSGTILLVLNGTALFGSPWSGAIVIRRGARLAVLIGTTIGVSAWLATALHHSTLWFVVAANFIMQFGLSVVQPAAFNLVVEGTPRESTSEATGLTFVFLYTMMAIGGQIIFLLLAGSTVTDAASGAGTFPDGAAFRNAFIYVLAAGAVLFLLALALPRHGSGAEQRGHRSTTP